VTDPFASFVTDPASAAAVAAARTVADASRTLYGPLVLIGVRGAGKSHLLRAVRDRAAAQTPPRRAELISLLRLADVVHARGLGEGGSALRDRLLDADLLLIDDFEAVIRHLPVQAFVFDLLESRITKGREVVVASAAPIAGLADLDARLRRRVEAGTVVTLGLPGPDARRVVLDRRVVESGVQLAPAVTEALAHQELRSIKEYLGALQRVLAFQQTTPEALSAADALALLGLEATNGRLGPPDAAPAPTGATPPAEPPGPEEAEFDAFLSEVVANVSNQFDRWRGRIREAIAHWQSRGLRTRRLERALTDDLGGDPEPVIGEFGRDATELERLGAEVRAIAPDLAGAEVLRDPDQLPAARELVDEARSRRAPLSAPLAELTLDALGVGPSNRLALEAARALVADPGGQDTPLVVVGASGLGKTHLLHGVGNALIERQLSPIACLSAHSFLGEVSALRTAEETAAWRTRYQWVAGLLVDDLHVLAHESRAQEELLQIFGALADGGRPLAFASARRLSELEGFDPRLLTRLEAGLVVEILPPDREVRLAVVKALLAGTPTADAAALIDYLAGRPADSIRAVQGAVHRVLGEARGQRVTPSPALAREVLDVVSSKGTRPGRRVATPRGSGILSPGMGVVRSREKMIQRWPHPAERLMVELR
jgi:chromosomal replication initiation ATPase DnaA